MIIRGGENIYPREIEEVLYDHPGILECAVIGVPDEVRGEEVLALVAPKPGARARPRASSAAYAAERIAKLQAPTRFERPRRAAEDSDRQDQQGPAARGALA